MDPQLATHPREHPGVAASWLISLSWSGIEHPNFVPIQLLVADELEIESVRHLLQHRMILLPLTVVFSDPLGPGAGGFATSVCDFLLQFFLFQGLLRRRERLVIDGYHLVILRA